MASKARKSQKAQASAKPNPAVAQPTVLGPGPVPAVPPPNAKAGKRPPIVRILPLLIGVGALMLSVRVTDIFKGVFGPGSVSVAELQAQQQAKPAAPPAAPQAPAKPAAQAPAEKPPTAPAPSPQPATTGQPPATTATPGDGQGMTQTELDVLQKLQERRGVLDIREKDIERREALLKAAEEQIDRKVAEMKTLQNTIEGLLRQYNDQEDNKMRSLVKIYENMKPKEAAKIFEQLDMGILLEVLERMKEQKVAPILAEMDPSKAKGVTAELAQRRQIPMPKMGPGG